jgi:hypothetical protein
MSKSIRALALVGALVVAFAAFTITAGAAGSGKKDSGTIYTAITHTAGGYEYAAGNGTDKVLGTDAVTYKIKANVSATGISLKIPSIAIYTSTGVLSGTGTAKLAVSGTTETVSDGTFDLTSGSGAQKGHTYKGTFSGVGSTKTSQYVFHAKGTYK